MYTQITDQYESGFDFIDNKYVIRKGSREVQPFSYYPYQKKLLESLYDGQNVFVRHARKLGVSVTVAAFVLDKMLYNDNYTVEAKGSTKDSIKRLLDHIELSYNHLVDVNDDDYAELDRTLYSLTLENGSSISLVDTFSENADFIVIEGAAWVNTIEDDLEFLEKDFDGQFAITSNQIERSSNPLKDFWNSDKVKGYFWRWDLHPDRDKEWQKDQLSKMSKDAFKRKYHLLEF